MFVGTISDPIMTWCLIHIYPFAVAWMLTWHPHKSDRALHQPSQVSYRFIVLLISSCVSHIIPWNIRISSLFIKNAINKSYPHNMAWWRSYIAINHGKLWQFSNLTLAANIGMVSVTYHIYHHVVELVTTSIEVTQINPVYAYPPVSSNWTISQL